MDLLKQLCLSQRAQAIKNAMRSALSLAEGIPAKAMAFPGAKDEGFINHLSKLAADHFQVALDERAEEYEKLSPEAMLAPPIPPSAGPTESAEREWQTAHKFLKIFSPLAGSPDAFFLAGILPNEKF